MPGNPAPLRRPTDAELNILRTLWQLGPSTVRQVQDALGGAEANGYTTVLKLLQIMAEKGLVERDETARTHVYRPRLTEQHTQRQLIRDLLGRAFGGSLQKLIVQALSAERASPKELREIRRLIEEIERGKAGRG
jgi:predicted transcriptional regulator